MLLTVLVGLVVFVLAAPAPWYLFMLTGLADGLVATPLFVFVAVQYAPPVIRTKVGRLHYLYGAVLAGTVVAVLTGDGYRIGIPDETGQELVLDGDQQDDGRRVPFDESRTTWYRLANRRLGFTWLRDPGVLDEYEADDSFEVADESDDLVVFERTRQGVRAASTAPDLVRAHLDGGGGADGLAADGDGGGKVLLDGVRVRAPVRGGGSTQQTDKAETKAMKEEGGEGQMDMKVKMAGAIATIALASMVGILIFGVLA